MAFLIITVFFSCLLVLKVFEPIYISKEVVINFGLKPFDICKENIILWNYIKKTYIITLIFSSLVINNSIYNSFVKSRILSLNFKNKLNIRKSIENSKSNIKLLIGYDKDTNSNVSKIGLQGNMV